LLITVLGERAIFAFAFKNLWIKKIRTLLALLGLSFSILGIICLVSLSGGIKSSMLRAISLIQGIIVLQKDCPSPVLSNLPEAYGEKIEQIPGVKVVVPEILFPALSIEGKSPFQLRISETFVLIGSDLRKALKLQRCAVYREKLLRGRIIRPGDSTQIMVSERAVTIFKKDLGNTLQIYGRTYEIVGVFETGVFFLDHTLLLPIEQVRAISKKGEGRVSDFFIETESIEDTERVSRAIMAMLPDVDARSSSEWGDELWKLMGDVDLFLVAISSVAIVVGAIGVLNTMLMSVMERFCEFGILRAIGWNRWDVVRLVMLESLLLGLTGGITGCILGRLLVGISGFMLPLPPVAGPGLLAGAFCLALVLGLLGGIYPAYRASRLNPIDAIRYG
jgi:putative ABC transport system permease protein